MNSSKRCWRSPPTPLRQRKVGELPEALVNVIRELGSNDLEALGEAVFDLDSVPQIVEKLVLTVDADNGERVVQSAVLLKLVEAHLGELAEPVQQQLVRLSTEQVRILSESVWEWESQSDLLAWLN